MLKTNRPGVFRAAGAGGWFVIDPAQPAELEQEWRALHEVSPISETRRTMAFLAGWITFLTLFGAVLLAAAIIAQSLLIVGVLLPIVGFIPTVIVGLLAHSAIARVKEPQELKEPQEVKPLAAVIDVHWAITKWANDSIPRETIWQLNSAVHRFTLLTSAVRSLEPQLSLWNEIIARSPSLEVARADLTDALAATKLELERLADLHGFVFKESDLDPYNDD